MSSWLGVSLDEAVSALQETATRIAQPSGRVHVPDATDAREHHRSPAAAHIAEASTALGLHAFHFERRAHLPLPPSWVPADDPALADPPEWDGGVLPERKYQSFRHDLILASFHPHHRAKWGAHELCHGLVGYAWRPDGTPLFHATAGRLAELLPVALWYFFDEAHVQRCPLHQGGGALFRTLCPACEAAAAVRVTDDRAAHHIAEGLAFVERELDAIARTRAEGRPTPHQWATIDLCSDGIAYARAHHARLSSPIFAQYHERFCVHGSGWQRTLDGLQDRVVALLQTVLLGRPLPDVPPTPEHGRWRWRAQDVAWRVLQAHGDTPQTAAVLDACEALVRTSLTPDPMRPAVRALHDAIDAWADDADVFQVGYDLHPQAPSAGTLADGIRSALPLTVAGLEDDATALVIAFQHDGDDWSRRPLATRFADWLSRTRPGPLADLATFEAAICTLSPHATPAPLGPPQGSARRLADGYRALSFQHDVFALAERVDAGEVSLSVDGRAIHHAGDAVAPMPTSLIMGRDAQGEVLLLDVDPDAAQALRRLGPGAIPELPDDELEALESHGALVPVAMHFTLPHV